MENKIASFQHALCEHFDSCFYDTINNKKKPAYVAHYSVGFLKFYNSFLDNKWLHQYYQIWTINIIILSAQLA